jgi:hypothetical protein
MGRVYIGWDVGAWKCARSKDASCDAIVVMDESRIVGFHRDNLGGTIRRLLDSPVAGRPGVLVEQWLSLCGGEAKARGYSPDTRYYVAIDTPLGWPKDFKGLLDGSVPSQWGYQPAAANIENTLLYRYTERAKLKSGLSVVVDSIGSQSAKGMLLLQLLGAKSKGWGVWEAGNVTLFETYPKACLVRAGFVEWMAGLNLSQNLSEPFTVQVSKRGEKPKKYGTLTVIAEDVFDAGVCSCVARAFAAGSPELVRPGPNDPVEWTSEGWIFYPDQTESVVDQTIADGHHKATCCEGVKTFQEAVEAFRRHLTDRPT